MVAPLPRIDLSFCVAHRSLEEYLETVLYILSAFNLADALERNLAVCGLA